MINKTNLGLVNWAKSRIGQGYVYGTYFSAPITEEILQYKAGQYPNIYGQILTVDGVKQSYLNLSRRWIGKYAGDCVGLIKSYYWNDPVLMKVIKGLDGRPDKSANGMFNAGQTANGGSIYANKGKTWGTIATIPEVPGMLVWKDGHIGIYIGNGQVIESRGVLYGVVQTALAGRPWTHWCICAYISYYNESEDTNTMLQKGDKGQTVYDYQLCCKALGYDVGTFKDMKTGQPTGCDGDFGLTMFNVTKKIQADFGLPETGVVDAATYGKLAVALKNLVTGISQAKYDEAVARATSAEQEAVFLKTITTDLSNQLKVSTEKSNELIEELKDIATALDTLDIIKEKY